MERRTGFCLAGTLLAFSLASLPAIAQNQNMTHRTDWTMNTDWTVPVSPAQDKMMALQTLNDHGFTKADITAVLPLLEDLQTAESNYDATEQHAAIYWMINPGSASDTANPDPAGAYRGAHDSIWNTINQKVGADKANALRQLIEPVPQDPSTFTYRSARLDRIDSLLADLDREEAARIAMIQNSAQPGQAAPTTASVETTTITRTTYVAPMPGFTFYTLPPLTTTQLVDLLNEKLALMEGGREGWMYVRAEQMTAPDLSYLRQHRMWQWK